MTADGRIQGTIPQYIKRGEENFEPVTEMRTTFLSLNLEVAPIIPSTVTCMHQTFLGCEKLTTAPTMPDGLIDMSQTFNRLYIFKKCTYYSKECN